MNDSCPMAPSPPVNIWRLRPAEPDDVSRLYRIFALHAELINDNKKWYEYRSRFKPELFRLVFCFDRLVAAARVEKTGKNFILKRIVLMDGWALDVALPPTLALFREEAARSGLPLLVYAPAQDTPWRAACEQVGFHGCRKKTDRLEMEDMTTVDDYWMGLALEEAAWGEEEDEVPIGAVVVKDGNLLASTHNRPLALNDPTAHAEMLALRQAAQTLGASRLEGAWLYVTIEPCVMCVGAMIHSRLERLVFGASNEKFGALRSCCCLLDVPQWNHRVAWRGDVMAAEAAQLTQAFFERRRR